MSYLYDDPETRVVERDGQRVLQRLVIGDISDPLCEYVDVSASEFSCMSDPTGERTMWELMNKGILQ